ncbi:MAG: extracellular solute-binding protein [Oscillospiraceae bacterium]|nr:extracellular solute-binding protein [Oscillospiraceae bacterium]
MGSGGLKKRRSDIPARTTRKRLGAVSLAAALLMGLLLVVAGCQPSNNIVNPIPDTPIDLTPTDELVLYLPGYQFLDPGFMAAVKAFENTYPGVKVTVEVIGAPDRVPEGDYQTRINTEAMAGTGPDVFLTSYFFDMYETMELGAYLNLEPIIAEDEDFALEDYNGTVMDAGVYKGGRYIIPLKYYLPILLTEQGILDDIGFDIAQDVNFISFFNEVADSLPKARENPSFIRLLGDRIAYEFTQIAGVSLIDREREIILPDEKGLRAVCESYKPYWVIDSLRDDQATTFGGNVWSVIQEGAIVFGEYQLDIFNTVFDLSQMKATGYTPVLSAIRRADGGLNASVGQSVAIRAGSPNQLNAWRYIKILLSESMQNGGSDIARSCGFPVNKAALRRELDGILKEDTLINTPEGKRIFQAVPWSDKEPYLVLHESITSCTLPDMATNWLYSSMKPWFDGKKSYEDCLEDLRQRLTLYFSE